jgi:hypothetical protein
VVELVPRLVAQPLLRVIHLLRGGEHPAMLKEIAGIVFLSDPEYPRTK